MTGESRVRAGKKRLQVRFPDRDEFHPVASLELVVDEVAEDVLDLAAKKKFGRARDLRKGLTFIMLNGRLANLIYSMNTTNTEFLAYQYKPVLDYLDSPSNGLLIADEVGLGKTIEAGLIWTELRSRFDARRLLIICPAMLRDKWQIELRNRFGIEAEQVDAAGLLERIRQIKTGSRAETALIGSLQGLRPPKGWQEKEPDALSTSGKLAAALSEVQYEEPIFDLVIIDEAHYLRNPETSSFRLGQLARDCSDGLLLLSATPVNLGSEDLFTLLNLVDPDNFDEKSVFDEVLEANRHIIQARDMVLAGKATAESLRDALLDALHQRLLSQSTQLKRLAETLPAEAEFLDKRVRTELANRLERVNLLGRAVTRTRKRDVTELRVLREAVTESIQLSEKEADLYQMVTETIRDYCSRSGNLEGFLLVMPQRQVSSSMPAALQAWHAKAIDAELLYEDIGTDDEPERGPIVDELVSRVSEFGSFEELKEVDSKYHRLTTMLKGYLEEHPDEKVVLFSYFKPTLRYLLERLAEDGIAGVLLVGGMSSNKQEVIDEFRTSSARVLLASEVASEGVDLQFCRLLINYDLPWNPMKVEQRIGRIDRIGQKAEKITIWNLLYADTIDERIYERLFARLRIFEQSLGGLEAVIGEKIRVLTRELLSNRLSPEAELEQIEQTAQAIENIRARELQLEEEAPNLIAHSDYILDQIRAADTLNRSITGRDLWIFVSDFVKEHYPGCQFKQISTDQLVMDVSLSPQLRVELDSFLRDHGLLGKTRLATNTARPIRCEFRNSVVNTTLGSTELISQFHPLVRFISSCIRLRRISPYPLVAFRASLASADVPVGVYAFYVHRWSFQGIREIEQLRYVVYSMTKGEFLDEDTAEMFIRDGCEVGEDWFSLDDSQLSSYVDAIETCLEKAESDYERFTEQLVAENADRCSFQKSSLERHRERQIATLERIKSGHVINKRESLVRATEGRIRALNERIEQRLIEIDRKKNVAHSAHEVAGGIALIN